MQDLIKINYESEQPTVSARELHEGLEIKTKFTMWFDRMCEYGFELENDFKKCFPKLGSGLNGGQNAIDYESDGEPVKDATVFGENTYVFSPEDDPAHRQRQAVPPVFH